jgi:hypothetical protein
MLILEGVTLASGILDPSPAEVAIGKAAKSTPDRTDSTVIQLFWARSARRPAHQLPSRRWWPHVDADNIRRVNDDPSDKLVEAT